MPWRKKKNYRVSQSKHVVEDIQVEELIPQHLEDLPSESHEEMKSDAHVVLKKQTKLKSKRITDKEEVEEVTGVWRQEMNIAKEAIRREPERQGILEQDFDKPLTDLEIVSKKRTYVDKRTLKYETSEMPSFETASILPPRFVERIQPVVTEEDKPVLFTCTVEGTPFPDLTWYHNGKLVEATERFVMTIYETTATLEIMKPQPQDAGVYSCRRCV